MWPSVLLATALAAESQEPPPEYVHLRGDVVYHTTRPDSVPDAPKPLLSVSEAHQIGIRSARLLERAPPWLRVKTHDRFVCTPPLFAGPLELAVWVHEDHVLPALAEGRELAGEELNIDLLPGLAVLDIKGESFVSDGGHAVPFPNPPTAPTFSTPNRTFPFEPGRAMATTGIEEKGPVKETTRYWQGATNDTDGIHTYTSECMRVSTNSKIELVGFRFHTVSKIPYGPIWTVREETRLTSPSGIDIGKVVNDWTIPSPEDYHEHGGTNCIDWAWWHVSEEPIAGEPPTIQLCIPREAVEVSTLEFRPPAPPASAHQRHFSSVPEPKLVHKASPTFPMAALTTVPPGVRVHCVAIVALRPNGKPARATVTERCPAAFRKNAEEAAMKSRWAPPGVKQGTALDLVFHR